MAENCLDTAGGVDAPWDLKPFTDHRGQYYDLGEYITCAIANLWTPIRVILIAFAVILVLRLIYKTVTNRDNSSVIEEVRKEWLYVMLLAIVVVGGAGTILNFGLEFFGLGNVQLWLNTLTDFLDWF